MKITEIVVHEGRGYNHPYEQFSNFKQGITLKATIEEAEDVNSCIRRLHGKAVIELEGIKIKTLNALNKCNSLEEAKRAIESELGRIKSGDDIPF